MPKITFEESMWGIDWSYYDHPSDTLKKKVTLIRVYLPTFQWSYCEFRSNNLTLPDGGLDTMPSTSYQDFVKYLSGKV